jgi:outer membrane protein OmpA-like peptidoglycan-associated protein
LRVPEGGIAGALGSLLGGLLSSPEVDSATMRQGTLKRVEAKPIPFNVILNDDPVELMAIHARGQLGEDPAEFWILDDGDNPLALKWEVAGSRLQVIRLSYPENVPSTTKEAGPATSAPAAANAAAGTAKRIEEDLAKDGRSIIYGIYFDFASDRIKEESEPVLSEIAQVLRTNPTWNLNVEGHTDSIGSDADNLDLSRRRSAAVKQALTTRYKIDLNRLQTSGYGESRPKDRNDTMEGRARNRRVELVKG